MKKILKGEEFVASPVRSYWKCILYGIGQTGDREDRLQPCGLKLLEFFGFLDDFVEAQGQLVVPVEFAVYALAEFEGDLLDYDQGKNRGYLVPSPRGRRKLAVCGKLILPKVPQLGMTMRSIFDPEVLLAFSPGTRADYR